MKEFIISPPFGTFINSRKCTSVLGTYTLHKRGGWLKKLYRILQTVRPIKNGWVNKIGLQNPGIKSIKTFDQEKIYSIAAIHPNDWKELINYLPEETMVELNISCPNIDKHTDISDKLILTYLKKFPIVIFKLSPTNTIYIQIDRLVLLGAKYVHIANTLPTSRGGESGERLKTFSLEAIKKVRKKYPQIKIIGGGGIYSPKDVELYKSVGANYFSLASIWFNPLKALQLLQNY